MIHHSPLPDVEIPQLPLTEYVLAGGAGQRDKPALIDGASGRMMTYGELEDAIRSLAGGLAAAGFGRGDVLALMAPNGPEYAVVFHGAAMAGGTVTTINPAYTQAEVHHQLADSGARILVTIAPLADAAVRACAGTAVTEVYLLGETSEASEALPVRPLSALAGRRWPRTSRSAPTTWWRCRTPRGPQGWPRASCSPTRTWWPTSPRRWGRSRRRPTSGL
jgi:acyl-CoA synthetase (AMP-forming)/AMP-acid ligase II